MLQVKIRALAYGGAGVGQVVAGPDAMLGKVCFVKFAAPGELVEAQALEETRSFVTASLTRVIEPSPERRTARCKYFGVCGGCDLQHLNIAGQREAKRNMIESMLTQQGKLSLPSKVILLAPELPEFGYRTRIGLHLAPDGRLGFYRTASGEVVDIEQCPIAHDSINATLTKLRAHIGALTSTVGGIEIEGGSPPRIRINLLEGAQIDSNTIEPLRSLSSDLVIYSNGQVVFAQVNNTEVSENELAVGHFSQVNEAGNNCLVSEVLAQLQGTHVTEFYAGAGNFSLALARRGTHVTAIEADDVLINLGNRLAQTSGLSSLVRFVRSSAEKFAKRGQLNKHVLLDPPRSGAKGVVEYFDPQLTTDIVYVSCNLPSLTRDLKYLCGAGYSLCRIAAIDMFPQTHHVEIVATLRASNKVVPGAST
ncbi:MAG: hypothetical protein K1X79_07475 [Oligoflexia bacterium]|nr:hypothetical protein [Oligoflexia bacterium]